MLSDSGASPRAPNPPYRRGRSVWPDPGERQPIFQAPKQASAFDSSFPPPGAPPGGGLMPPGGYGGMPPPGPPPGQQPPPLAVPDPIPVNKAL